MGHSVYIWLNIQKRFKSFKNGCFLRTRLLKSYEFFNLIHRMTSAERKMQEVEKEWIALENEEKRFLLNKKDTENKLEVLCLVFSYISYHIL